VPVTVYVEQFSAHPLEAEFAELYGPPDGYVDNAGRVRKERQGASDKPVYEVELRLEDAAGWIVASGGHGGILGAASHVRSSAPR
jgi:hypothetical protein